MEQLEDPLAIATVKKELDKRKMKRELSRKTSYNLVWVQHTMIFIMEMKMD